MKLNDNYVLLLIKYEIIGIIYLTKVIHFMIYMCIYIFDDNKQEKCDYNEKYPFPRPGQKKEKDLALEVKCF